MRRGCRKTASIATMRFGMGSRSSGLAPSGSRSRPPTGLKGSCGGTVGVIVLIFLQVLKTRVKYPHQRTEDGFVEVPVKCGFSKKLHRQFRRTDERAQNPGNLASQKEISNEP